MPNLIDIKQFNQPKLSGFFTESISEASGELLHYASGIAYQVVSGQSVMLSGEQDISGIKNFISRPTVNDSGILLQGELDLSNFYTKNNPSGFITGVNLSNYVTKLNGQFSDRPTVNGSGVLLIGEVTQNTSPQNISPQNISAQVDLSSTVRTTGAQTISGEKTFLDTITFKKDIILSGATPWPNPNVSLGMEMSNGIYFDNFYQSPYIKYYAGYENTLEIRSPGGSPGALNLLNGNEYIILDGDTSEIFYRAYTAHNFIGSPIFVDTISLRNIVGQGNGIFAPLNPTAPIKVTGKLKINDGLDISSIEGRSDISGSMSLELKAGINKILIEKEDGDAIAIQSPNISFSSRPKVNGTGVLLSGEAVRSDGTVNSMIRLTQAQYNALSSKDANTFYVIVG